MRLSATQISLFEGMLENSTMETEEHQYLNGVHRQ